MRPGQYMGLESHISDDFTGHPLSGNGSNKVKCLEIAVCDRMVSGLSNNRPSLPRVLSGSNRRLTSYKLGVLPLN